MAAKEFILSDYPSGQSTDSPKDVGSPSPLETFHHWEDELQKIHPLIFLVRVALSGMPRARLTKHGRWIKKGKFFISYLQEKR